MPLTQSQGPSQKGPVGGFDPLTADSTTTARRAVRPQNGNLCPSISGLKVKPSMSDTGGVVSINCRNESAYAGSGNPRNLNLLVFSLPPRGARDSWKSYTKLPKWRARSQQISILVWACAFTGNNKKTNNKTKKEFIDSQNLEVLGCLWCSSAISRGSRELIRTYSLCPFLSWALLCIALLISCFFFMWDNVRPCSYRWTQHLQPGKRRATGNRSCFPENLSRSLWDRYLLFHPHFTNESEAHLD